MAKKSTVGRNERKMAVSKRLAPKRAKLKAAIKDPKTSPADRAAAQQALQSLPRDASPIRIKNRCSLTGRARGYLRAFGLSRNQFRELALNGVIPGVRKASW
jgi:small subunit ribosomal protein S14